LGCSDDEDDDDDAPAGWPGTAASNGKAEYWAALPLWAKDVSKFRGTAGVKGWNGGEDVAPAICPGVIGLWWGGGGASTLGGGGPSAFLVTSGKISLVRRK
jgi:hypothetical protein